MSKHSQIKRYSVLLAGTIAVMLYWVGWSPFGATIESWVWTFVIAYGGIVIVLIGAIHVGTFIYEKLRQHRN